MLNPEKQNELLSLARRLIRCRSYSGEEQNIAAVLTDYWRAAGFGDVHTDRFGNVLACAAGAEKGPCILFDGHIDTVPVGNEKDWTHPPFAATVEDGKLYGRGAADMKAAVAGFSFAAAEFLKKHGNAFSGRLCLAGVVHEECFEGVSARSISAELQPDLVIIGEASEMNLKRSQRGRAEIILETFGVPCHSSNPEKGVNAVYSMCTVIDAFRRLPVPEVPGMAGPGMMELTDIRSEPYPGASVLPEYCRATFDRRLLVGETRESVLAPLRGCIERLQRENPKLKARVFFSEGSERCYTGETIAADRFFPGWLLPEDNRYLRKIHSRVKAAGYSPALTGYSFCTNGSHYAGEAGIPCIGIGPSRENLAHTVDEYVPLEDLYAVADYYLAAMEAVLCE